MNALKDFKETLKFNKEVKIDFKERGFPFYWAILFIKSWHSNSPPFAIFFNFIN